MKYFIITYGCQMNKSDSERIAQALENIGYRPASKENEADLILVNMCSVRQSAADRVYGKIKDFDKLKAQSSKLKTILTGCILKTDKRKFAKGFDFILDIKDMPALLEKLNINTKHHFSQKHYLDIRPKHKSLFSALLPIMTGCNNFCSFCVVPYSRGREISRSPKEILSEIKNSIKNKYKEIWLLGQNVNSYNAVGDISTESRYNSESDISSKTRYKSQTFSFPKLLKMINAIPGNFWIRFTSSHPKDLSDELIETMAGCKKVTPYLNLPVQSGDDEILKRMNRPYTVGYYRALVKKIRRKIPNICLSTDVIVGFPGETRKQFQNTVKLFREIKFDMAYISQYSPRPGTLAFKMRDSVSRVEKGQRWSILNEVLKSSALEQNQKYIGKKIEVLAQERKDGLLIGKSRHYKTVRFIGPERLIGQFVKVKILNATAWGLKGEYEKL
jgi:tRNA-2-methylthio-N6-dimethylallyladenosine synthase